MPAIRPLCSGSRCRPAYRLPAQDGTISGTVRETTGLVLPGVELGLLFGDAVTLVLGAENVLNTSPGQTFTPFRERTRRDPVSCPATASSIAKARHQNFQSNEKRDMTQLPDIERLRLRLPDRSPPVTTLVVVPIGAVRLHALP